MDEEPDGHLEDAASAVANEAQPEELLSGPHMQRTPGEDGGVESAVGWLYQQMVAEDPEFAALWENDEELRREVYQEAAAIFGGLQTTTAE